MSQISDCSRSTAICADEDEVRLGEDCPSSAIRFDSNSMIIPLRCISVNELSARARELFGQIEGIEEFDEFERAQLAVDIEMRLDFSDQYVVWVDRYFSPRFNPLASPRLLSRDIYGVSKTVSGIQEVLRAVREQFTDQVNYEFVDAIGEEVGDTQYC